MFNSNTRTVMYCARMGILVSKWHRESQVQHTFIDGLFSVANGEM